MKIKVTKDFFDRESDMTLRSAGEELEVTDSRAAFLAGKGLCDILREPEKREKPAKKQSKQTS